MASILRDPALAPQGRTKVDFADERMPVLRSIRERLARERSLEGHRVAACLHVTTETANLCRALVAGGAELALCASNPLSTKDDVAAAVQADLDAEVYAVHGCDRATFYRQLDAALALEPTIVVDDGADLTARLHARRPELADAVHGGTEVTSTGVQRLRNMAAAGALRYGVVAVNDARTKHLFDNRYGAGQNTIDGILRATNALLAGSVFVVVGFGWVGRGIAARARGMGARVVVCEVDPLRALEAVMEGFDVRPVREAAADADVVVTATGNRDALGLAELEALKPGAIVANSGHFDVEIDVAGLRETAVATRAVREHVVEYELAGGGRVQVLAEGRLVGQSCAEANPAAVMDLTFSTQALAIERIAARERLEPGVHEVAPDVDELVARAKLRALGIEHDELSETQRAYLASWDAGT
jgi:adenosylhomocysteinase